QIKVRVDMV
nr:Chain C, QIK peptide from CMV [Cytomegalovirus]